VDIFGHCVTSHSNQHCVLRLGCPPLHSVSFR